MLISNIKYLTIQTNSIGKGDVAEHSKSVWGFCSPYVLSVLSALGWLSFVAFILALVGEA